MLSLVTHWARIDDTQLGRPKLSGQEEVNPLAVPMMVLYVIDEVCRDEERLQNIYSEDEEWAVQQILKHLQVLMSRRGAGARFSKVPIINGPGKPSPFILKIEVSKVLHLA